MYKHGIYMNEFKHPLEMYRKAKVGTEAIL